MDRLTQQVRHARRRLTLQRFLGILGWCWFAALAVALVPLVVGRIHPLGVKSWAWPVVALVAGAVIAIVWTWLSRPRSLEAALEIDRRFGLKERVSSTLALSPAQCETDAGRALVTDAAARLRRIEVAEKFPVRLPRQILLPLVPGLAAVLAIVFIHPKPLDASATGGDVAAVQPEVKKAAESLREKLAERREKAEKDGLKDATELLKKLEEGTKELKSEPRRDKALVKLNDLARQIEQRRQQLGGAEKLKQQLEQLKHLERGPEDKLAKALARGDFKKAAEELEKIKQEIANSKPGDPKNEELAKQLEQMQKKLNQLADDAKAAQADLQKRADQMRQNGQKEEADKLQQQIDQFAQQAPHMQRMQQLAQQLGQCAMGLRQGQGGKAGQALDQAMQQLKQLQQQMKEMQTLDEALKQLADARNQMNCEKCGGAGCKECQGDGMCAGQGMGEGDEENQKPGVGMGPGKGFGARPEKKSDGRFYDSQVRQKVGKGAGMVTDLVEGPNLKGHTDAELLQNGDTVQHGSTDPLSGQRIPRKYGEHAREYFDRFREGK